MKKHDLFIENVELGTGVVQADLDGNRSSCVGAIRCHYVYEGKKIVLVFRFIEGTNFSGFFDSRASGYQYMDVPASLMSIYLQRLKVGETVKFVEGGSPIIPSVVLSHFLEFPDGDDTSSKGADQ